MKHQRDQTADTTITTNHLTIVDKEPIFLLTLSELAIYIDGDTPQISQSSLVCCVSVREDIDSPNCMTHIRNTIIS